MKAYLKLCCINRSLIPTGQYQLSDSTDTDKNSIPPFQPNRILSDISPLQRVIIAVAVVIQAGLLIILLPRQADKLLQLMRVLFIQQVAPLIVFCAPFCSTFRADKRQRQAAMVAVVQVDFFAPACTPGPSGFASAPPSGRTMPASGGFPHSPGQPGFHFPAGRASAPCRRESPTVHRQLTL